MPIPREQRAVQSVEVGGRLLMALANSPAPMALKDLAAAADLPPSRAHPYLVSFGKLGLIEQLQGSGAYALGPAALQLGLTYLYQLDPMKPVNAAAKALAASTGQAVAIAVWGNFGPTAVRLLEARRPLYIALRPGNVLSILGTATGRAFAATLPKDRVEQALQGPLNEAAHSSAARIAKELKAATAEVQAQGMTRTLGRPLPGINAYSAPVFNADGDVVAVLTLIGHEEELTPDWDGPMPKALQLAAHEAGARLGHRVQNK